MNLELHLAMRSLIPNRTDLHAVLSDDNVKNANDDVQYLILHLIRAGEALLQLESEDRSSSTLAWVNLSKRIQETSSSKSKSILNAKSMIPNTIQGMTYAIFLVASAAYLNLKA